MIIPRMTEITQHFDRTCIEDAETAVIKALTGLELKIPEGARIAITAGSRGIDRIPEIIKAIADQVKIQGGIPFIVPAMGTHGGATALGQQNMLAGLGITPETIGAPVISSMETMEIGTLDTFRYMGGCTADPSNRYIPIHIDKNAYQADGIIVVNRIKPHTSFHAEIESGMMKMIAIGLGKQAQAVNIHRYGTAGLRTLIAPAAHMVLSTGKILAGIGIIENAYDKLTDIKAYLPSDIEKGEKELLGRARLLMPRLPADELDVLIVEEMGKNISGTGMDTNIIGRIRIEGETEPGAPDIKRIVVLDLTKEAGGNAYGVGLADVTTRKLVNKIDYKATYANVLATGFIERVKIPMIAADEKEALEMALSTAGIKDASNARIVRIKNTLQLEHISVSDSIIRMLYNNN